MGIEQDVVIILQHFQLIGNFTYDFLALGKSIGHAYAVDGADVDAYKRPS